MLSRLPERHARLLRWLLISGWLALLVSLLIPAIPIQGNRLFWGTVVPAGVLIIGAISHELWRRLCPLAFVSQLAGALGLQRTRPGKGKKPELVMVKAESWLGRHHVEFQWSLLIAGLCLRLLGGNSDPHWLALWLLFTLLAAVVVGWAYGGKAWCQYVCPMGPVQTVLTGVRGPLGTTAHVAAPSRITQSMCRTITEEGKERSACVACQTPCLDIDAERGFWQNLQGKRGLGWAWYSYPGLVAGFFSLMEWSAEDSGLEHPLGYIRSGLWAQDRGLVGRALLPFSDWGPLPRLLMIPLLLTAAAWLSVLVCRWVERLLTRQGEREGLPTARERAVHRTRLLASYVAINLFFWFTDPLQGVFSLNGGQLLRSLVLLLTSIGLFRGWGRDQATYRRESTSDSLRRRLRGLPGLEPALDGRSLEALSPEEVFTLVKAMPAVGLVQARRVYGEVMAEMLRSGRLDQAQSLLELQELRQSLQLDDEDHHAVVALLGKEHPELLEKTSLERQSTDLREEVAHTSLVDFLLRHGLTVLQPEGLTPRQREELDRLRLTSGLPEAAWDSMVQAFGPQGELERQRLAPLREDWMEEAALLAWLAEQGAQDPPLRPLQRVLDRRVSDLKQELVPRLEAAGLDPLPDRVAASGDQSRLFDLLWEESDPDTAAWVLMLERQRCPEQHARRLQDSHPERTSSAFLRNQLNGEPMADQPLLEALTHWPMFADVPPSVLVWLAARGTQRPFTPGEVVLEEGSPSDHLALVLVGDVRVQLSGEERVTLGPGHAVGEIGVITSQPRTASVVAGPEGCRLFMLPAAAFEDLLRRSDAFSRSLLAQLARRLAQATRRTQERVPGS
ncbi:MAG: cyclic nucleotide-binding domain-containing protein [Cyanobium sp.]